MLLLNNSERIFAAIMSEKKPLAISGALAISIGAILWGLDGVVLTPRLYNLPVAFVVFILHAIPFLLMNFIFSKEYRLLRSFSKRDSFFMFMASLLGGALGTLAIVKALFLVNFQSLSVVVLLQKLQPIFAISLAAIILKEKIKKGFLPWAALAIIAGYFLTFGLNNPNFETGSNTGLAAVYSILAAMAFGASTVFSRGVVQHIPFQAATFFRYGITTIIMLAIVLATGSLASFQSITANNWLIIFIIIFTTGSGAIFLYYYGLRKVPAMVATILELLYPISAIIFDYIFNNRTLSLLQWFAAIVMIFSIIKITFPKRLKA